MYTISNVHDKSVYGFSIITITIISFQSLWCSVSRSFDETLFVELTVF